MSLAERVLRYLGEEAPAPGDRLELRCPACCSFELEVVNESGRLKLVPECGCTVQQIAESVRGYRAESDKERSAKKKPRSYTTTALLSRVPVFLPTWLPQHTKRFPLVRHTPWGRVEISGPPLTQQHRSVLHALMVLRARKKAGDKLYYTMAELRQLARWDVRLPVLKRLLHDLRHTEIALYDKEYPDDPLLESAILSEFGRVKTDDAKNAVLFGKRIASPHRRRWVRFTPGFLALFGKDLALSYPKLVPIVNGMKHAASQAIATFMLSHRRCEYSLKVVCKVVGLVRNRMDFSKTHLYLQEDAEALKQCGIEYDAERRVLIRRDDGQVFVRLPEDFG